MDSSKSQQTVSTEHSSVGMRPLRILLADDNRDTVITLMLVLRDEGHEVEGVYSGEDALKTARARQFDAIILDIEMPGQSGYAIARELREHHYGNRCPLLIAISGKWVGGSDKLLAKVAGFDHHLTKPCDPNALIRLLVPLSMRLRRQR